MIVEIGARVTTGTTTGVPTGARLVKLQEGGVITSGRSGSMSNPPVLEPPFGSSSESILAGTSHARPGVIATCAVHRRQTNPSSSIRTNSNRSRRSRSLSSSLTGSLSRLFCGSFAAMSILSAMTLEAQWCSRKAAKRAYARTRTRIRDPRDLVLTLGCILSQSHYLVHPAKWEE